MTVIPLQLGALFGLGPRPARERSKGDRGRMIRRKDGAGHRQPLAEVNVKQVGDEFLLDAYIRGDRAAFTQLMSRYSNELLHFLTRFLGSRAAADDVFQETFMQVHLSAGTFDLTRRFKPWLFTIAANKARDYHRKHSRWSGVSLSASIDSGGDGECYIDLLHADIPNPDRPLLDAERSRLVKMAVDSLPVHFREILLLSYFQRLSYNQIADSLEIPLGTVKSRLHSAVAAFAQAWKDARRPERGGESIAERETGHSSQPPAEHARPPHEPARRRQRDS